MWQDAADNSGGWRGGWPCQYLPASHQSAGTAEELGQQSAEPAWGPCGVIGFASGFPTVETPWSRRCWLEFRINWVSTLFHMLRECLAVRLLRTGAWRKGLSVPDHTALRRGRWAGGRAPFPEPIPVTVPSRRPQRALPRWNSSWPQGSANCLWILDCVLDSLPCFIFFHRLECYFSRRLCSSSEVTD